MSSGSAPSQVRIRTDPDDGHASRYREIQRAKDVFDAGNNTTAVVDACRHARLDREAKLDALSYLAKRVDPVTLVGVVERLETSTLPIDVEIDANADHLQIVVDVAGKESQHMDTTDH